MSLNLFPDLAPNPNVHVIGNGYGLEKLQDNLVVLYYKDQVKETHEFKNGLDKRVFVVNLVNNKKVTKSLLAQALGISRQSIDDWLSYYERSGYEGLINSYKGSVKQGRKEEAVHLSSGNKSLSLQAARQESKQALLLVQPELDFPKQEGSLPDNFAMEYEEEENHYGGSFIYWAIFEADLGMSKFLNPHLGAYSLVIWLFLMMQVNKLGSLEQLKVVYKKSFGRLLGLDRLPSRPVLNQLLADTVNKKETSLLKENFSSYQIKEGLVEIKEFYLDGHFIPYTGKYRVKKGFHTQHRQMEPGQTALYIHDEAQRIVWFDLQEGKADMVASIVSYNSNFTNKGVLPLWVVDRELWGVNNFLRLANCRFVTWEKHTKKPALQQIAADQFGEPFDYNGKSYQVLEVSKKYKTKSKNKDGQEQSIELRRIILWNKSTDRRVALVAQDELLDTQELATALLKRWGRSENSFKHMGTRINMHYNPGRSLMQLSEQQEVANPAYKELKKQIRQTKNNLVKLNAQLGKMLEKTKQKKKLTFGKAVETQLAEKQVLQQELTELEQALQNCPPRVSIGSVKEGAAFHKIKIDTKNLWDMAGCIFWNSRKQLEKQLTIFLPNARDLLPVLEAITKSRAWIRSTSNTLFVRLEALDTPRFRKAQVQLCQALNEKNVTLPNGKLLRFSVKEEEE